MKRLLILLFIFVMCIGSAEAAMGDKVSYITITTTGTQAFDIGYQATEIYYTRTSTNACYIGWTDLLCDGSTNYELIPANVTSYVTGNNEIRTNQVSVYTLILPFNIQFRAKGWK